MYKLHLVSDLTGKVRHSNVDNETAETRCKLRSVGHPTVKLLGQESKVKG